MFSIDEMTVFVAVVREGSFSGAARTLGTQKAHTSRVVSRLERRLAVRLLQRSTRSLAATEVGLKFFERAASILAALDETQMAIKNTQSKPQGVLKLTCGVEFGLQVVSRWIRSYLRRYPEVRVDANFSDRIVDIVQQGFDLAIRIGDLPDSSLAGRALGTIHYALYASPGYLGKRSEPVHPQDLISHDVIISPGFPTTGLRLQRENERADVGVTARLVVNNHMAARDATADGFGIGLLPRFQAAPLVDEGKLVEVLSGWSRAPSPVTAILPTNRYLSPKVRAFVDLARNEPIIGDKFKSPGPQRVGVEV
jgi:LysR family transcriptional regulator, regulator for bpeEF and oprC